MNALAFHPFPDYLLECPPAPRAKCVPLFEDVEDIEDMPASPSPPAEDADAMSITSCATSSGSTRASLNTIRMGFDEVRPSPPVNEDKQGTSRSPFARISNVLGLQAMMSKLPSITITPPTPRSPSSPRSDSSGDSSLYSYIRSRLAVLMAATERRKAEAEAHKATPYVPKKGDAAVKQSETAPPSDMVVEIKHQASPAYSPFTPGEIDVRNAQAEAASHFYLSTGGNEPLMSPPINPLRINYNGGGVRSSQHTPELVWWKSSPDDSAVTTPLKAEASGMQDYRFPTIPRKAVPKEPSEDEDETSAGLYQPKAPATDARWSPEMIAATSPLEQLSFAAHKARHSGKFLQQHRGHELLLLEEHRPADLPVPTPLRTVWSSPHLSTIVEATEEPIGHPSNENRRLTVRQVGWIELQKENWAKQLRRLEERRHTVPEVTVRKPKTWAEEIDPETHKAKVHWLVASSQLLELQYLDADDLLDHEFRESTVDTPHALVIAVAARSDTVYSLFWRVLGIFAGRFDLSLMDTLRLPDVRSALARAECSTLDLFKILQVTQRLDRDEAGVPLEKKRFQNGGDYLQRWNGATFVRAIKLFVPNPASFSTISHLPLQIRVALYLLMAYSSWGDYQDVRGFLRTMRHEHERYPTFPIVSPAYCVHGQAGMCW